MRLQQQIRQLRRFLDDNTMHTLIRALILSRLDYCISLYVGCTIMQDAAAINYVLTLVLSCSSFTGCLSPLTSRIQYKLCVLMFDIYRGTAPSYMLELCKRCTDRRLRSAAHGDFIIPRTRLRFTDRSFAVTGPKAWNVLPSRRYFNLQGHFS